VVWESPSEDASGAMPLGNGDIAAGVYAIEDGDLYLLLSKNDAYTQHGDIFKTGRVRIELSPNPFGKGKPFRQTLDLETGSIDIEADEVRLRIWADAIRPVYHVEVESDKAISVTAEPEFWERFESCAFNNFDVTAGTQEADTTPPVQDVRVDRKGNILWYYAVGDRSDFDADMKYYEVEDQATDFHDPYRYNTFGNLMESPDMELENGVLYGKGKRFDLRIHSLTKQTPEISEWIESLERLAAQPIDLQERWQAHRTWWSEFWDRSWITVSDNTLPGSERENFGHEGYRTTGRIRMGAPWLHRATMCSGI